MKLTDTAIRNARPGDRPRKLTGLSRMTIYRLELAGEFPKRRRLSKNSVAWLDTDIAQWAESRPVSQ